MLPLYKPSVYLTKV
ncbi:MAG TPA: hypothetical protein DCZ55_28455 [Cyanobacteria bacterium UBA11371]|nr:hypothetical protein [Cyanobacteria bacterium UBA11371]